MLSRPPFVEKHFSCDCSFKRFILTFLFSFSFLHPKSYDPVYEHQWPSEKPYVIQICTAVMIILHLRNCNNYFCLILNCFWQMHLVKQKAGTIEERPKLDFQQQKKLLEELLDIYGLMGKNWKNYIQSMARVIIVICACQQHGFLWLFLAMCPYQTSLLASSLDGIQCSHMLMNVSFCWSANVSMSMCKRLVRASVTTIRFPQRNYKHFTKKHIALQNTKAMICSLDGDTDFFGLLTGIMIGDMWASYLLILCRDYVSLTSIELKKNMVSH